MLHGISLFLDSLQFKSSLGSVDGIKVIERFYSLPLDYARPEGNKIRIFARNLVPVDKAKTPEEETNLPYCKFI